MYRALGAGAWCAVWMAIWMAATAVLAAWEWLRAEWLSRIAYEGSLLRSRYARAVYFSAAVTISYVLLTVLSQPAPAIIYKAF